MRLRAVILAAAAAFAGGSATAQDIASGQILFNQRCSLCHSLTRQSQTTIDVPLGLPRDMLNDPEDPGKTPAVGQKATISSVRQGPDLSGLLNREPGGLASYAYAEDYTNYKAFNRQWTEQTLDAWIDEHDDGRTGPEARVDIIAYLATLRGQ